VGSMINRKIDRSGNANYSLFNPSVADYVLNRTSKNPKLIEALFISLSSEKSLQNLWQLIKSGVVTVENAIPGLTRMAREQLLDISDTYSLNYKALLADIVVNFAPSQPGAIQPVREFVNNLTNIEQQFSRWSSLAVVLAFCLQRNLVDSQVVWPLIRDISSDQLGADALDSIASLRKELPKALAEEFESILRPIVRSYWEDVITREIQERGVLAEFYDESDYDDAERRAGLAIEDILAEYGLHFSASDVANILANCDIYEIISGNQQAASENDDYVYETRFEGSGGDEIDDLFIVDMPPLPAG